MESWIKNSGKGLKRKYAHILLKKFNEHLCPPGFVAVHVFIKTPGLNRIDDPERWAVAFELKRK